MLVKSPVGSEAESRRVMRKKTAPSTREHRTASISRQSGLIAKGENDKQSAMDKCALDNRSHRTSCASVAAAHIPRARMTDIRAADNCMRLLGSLFINCSCRTSPMQLERWFVEMRSSGNRRICEQRVRSGDGRLFRASIDERMQLLVPIVLVLGTRSGRTETLFSPT